MASSLEELKLPEIKKILRSCEVDPTDILAAKTRFELLELAAANGITDVPDEWTLNKIRQQKQLERDQARDDWRRERDPWHHAQGAPLPLQ